MPNVDIIEDVLRVHFHADGITFGMVDPHDLRFAALISYDTAKEIILDEAKVKRWYLKKLNKAKIKQIKGARDQGTGIPAGRSRKAETRK